MQHFLANSTCRIVVVVVANVVAMDF